MKITQSVYDLLSPLAQSMYKPAGITVIGSGAGNYTRISEPQGVQMYEPVVSGSGKLVIFTGDTGSIARDIVKEIARAKEKHPVWPVDNIHRAAIVAEESGELTRAAVQYYYEGGTLEAMREEAIQVAATAIRFIEAIDSDKIADNEPCLGCTKLGCSNCITEEV